MICPCNRCEADAGSIHQPKKHNVCYPTWRQINIRAVYPKSLCSLPAAVTGGCETRSRRPSMAPTTTKKRLAMASALCNWNHQPFLLLKRAIRMAAGMSKPHVLPMTVACLCMPYCTVTCRTTNLLRGMELMQGMLLCCKHEVKPGSQCIKCEAIDDSLTAMCSGTNRFLETVWLCKQLPIKGVLL